jgi:DNA segregation ATPase FtsK/SpoIIIE, S-DNA-T family
LGVRSGTRMNPADSCDECGFRYDSIVPDSVAERLRSFPSRFASALKHSDVRLRSRPRPEVWSAVEYTCHVRDTFLSQRERLYLALAVDVPKFAPMHRDLRVSFAHYNDEPVEQLLAQLSFAAALIGDAFARLEEDQWSRTCIYNYPVPAERSLLWVGQHTVHEGEHHLLDVTRGLQELQPH